MPTMIVPLADPETLVRDVVQITVVRPGPELSFPVTSAEGTGFVLGDGLLVTCWHCVAATPPPGAFYSAFRGVRGGQPWGSPIGSIERVGHADLAIGRVNYRGDLDLRIATEPPPIGTGVWTFGYPLTEEVRGHGDVSQFRVHPRILRGHITRRFVYEAPDGSRVPSWELSFAAPAGLSGAPVFVDGSLEVIGVVYGNNDSSMIEEFASVDPRTGKREPEIQRIVSFGLAHYVTSLKPIRERVGTVELHHRPAP